MKVTARLASLSFDRPNRNRTAADVRSALTHAGGSLGTSGSVSFQFERQQGPHHGRQEIETGDKKNPIGS